MSSPYLALRTVKQLKEYTSLAAEVIWTGLYMDELGYTISSEKEAQRLYLEVGEMFAEEKFDLIKTFSNSSDLLENIPTEKRLSKPVSFNTDTKTLGIVSENTKGIILFTVARFYDHRNSGTIDFIF